MSASRRRQRRLARQSQKKKCSSCGNKTRWLSVEGLCWDCLIKEVKKKSPLYIPEEADDSATTTDTSDNPLSSKDW